MIAVIVHIGLQDILIAIVTLAGSYTLLYNRKRIWRDKKPIFHAGILVSTLASVVMLGAIYVEEAKESERQITAKQYETRKNAREKYRLAGTTLKECEKPEQIYLPGEWWELYQQLDACNYFKSQFDALEAFTIHYSIDDVPPLPAAGFNLILRQFSAESDRQTTNHIEQCHEILGDYISPFEEPVCRPKTTKKPKSKSKTKET